MKWNKLRQLYRQNKHQFWKYIFYQSGIFLLTFGSAFGLFFLIDFLSEKMGYGHPSLFIISWEKTKMRKKAKNRSDGIRIFGYR